jgi:molybdopterin-guanine dinucleotide biosynthesis protein A
MLEWVATALASVSSELVLVAAHGQELPRIDATVPTRTVTDRYADKGPLAGLATGFRAVSTPLCFATSCDAPLLQPALARLLVSLADDCDVVCPSINGRLQPLTAVYRVLPCLPVFDMLVAQDALRLSGAFAHLRVKQVSEDDVRTVDPRLESFINANHREDIAEIEARLRERA